MAPGLRAQGSKTGSWGEGKLVSQVGPSGSSGRYQGSFIPAPAKFKFILELEQCFPGHPARIRPSDVPHESLDLAIWDCPQPATPCRDEAMCV